ncbi:MAG: lipopolysaccharide biosynthesis protein [Bacteroidota bacterium]
MKRFINKFLRSEFTRNVTFVSAGTAFSQLLGVLLSPVITRLFTPEEFGSFMFYNSFIGVASIIGTLKYEQSIPIARNKSTVYNLLFFCFLLSALSSFLLLLIMVFFGEIIAESIDWEAPVSFLLLFPIGLFFSNSYNTLMQWSFKRKHFKVNSFTKIAFFGVQGGGQIIFGLLKLTAIGLIIGNLVGRLTAVFIFVRKLFLSEKGWQSYLSARKIKWVAKRYIKFPYLILPSQLLSKFGQELPVFFLTFYFVGTGSVGQYTIANLIINTPILLIGTAIGDVFYSEASNTGMEQPERLLKLSNKLLKKLTLIGVVPLLIFFFLSPTLFTFFFGEQWYEAGRLAQIISVLGFIRLVLTPISRVFASFERHTLALSTNIFRVFMAGLAFVISYYSNMNIFDTLIIYTIAMSTVYIVTYLFARKVIKDQISFNKVQ